MKSFLFLCLLIILFAWGPVWVTADVDPTPYPDALYESVLEQYIGCAWAEDGMAFLFTGTPYDSDIFASRRDGPHSVFTIMTVADGHVSSMVESRTALFQGPVTELCCEEYDKISISFESGSGMLYQKGADQQWKLKSYTKCDENGCSFTVSMFDGPITYYEYDNPVTGEYKEDRLCGRLCLDTAFAAVDFKALPDSPDALKRLITATSSSESYRMDSVEVEDIPYYASCRLHGQEADIRIYAEGEIVRFDEDQPVRVTGFDVYVDGVYQGRTLREYIAQYDLYHGNIDISVSFSPDSEAITIVPCWEDETSDTAYSFVFPIN